MKFPYAIEVKKRVQFPISRRYGNIPEDFWKICQYRTIVKTFLVIGITMKLFQDLFLSFLSFKSQTHGYNYKHERQQHVIQF